MSGVGFGRGCDTGIHATSRSAATSPTSVPGPGRPDKRPRHQSRRGHLLASTRSDTHQQSIPFGKLPDQVQSARDGHGEFHHLEAGIDGCFHRGNARCSWEVRSIAGSCGRKSINKCFLIHAMVSGPACGDWWCALQVAWICVRLGRSDSRVPSASRPATNGSMGWLEQCVPPGCQRMLILPNAARGSGRRRHRRRNRR